MTPVLSKVMERIKEPVLNKSGAFGVSQWAFRPKHSCRDLIALDMGQWILDIARGDRVALFLNDISGAFD